MTTKVVKNSRRPSTTFEEKIHVDVKKAKTKNTLSAQLASSNPLASNIWWWVKHPVIRVLTCVAVLIINLYVYLGDPASFSSAKSYGTLVGDIYHGFFQPDDAEFVVLRLTVMFTLGWAGFKLGLYIQRTWLRDYFHLVLFGYDTGGNPNRDPLSDQEGAFFVIMSTCAMLWFIGLKIYWWVLFWAGADEKHLPDSGMYGLNFAAYNLILAGLFTYVCDWYALVAVTDQMLQAIDQKDGTGYLAYADDGTAHEDGGDDEHPLVRPERTEWLRKVAAWWNSRRLGLTRSLLVIGWPPVITAMIVNYFQIMSVLDGEPDTGVEVGRQWAWTASWNDEFMRMLAASLVALLNLAIVAQDWDFPDFTEGDIKIVAVEFSSFTFRLPLFLTKMLSSLPNISKYCVVYISAKWFNYFGIMMGVAFDWAYWFMTALPFRPCDYAQLWDKKTGYIYTMTDTTLQERFAGHQSAENCSWFTDNGVQDYYFNRDSKENPFVVRVMTGVFKGAYTLDEQDEFVWTGRGVVEMWLLCIPPLFGWVVVAWLIFTHERVTCFNYHKVLDWFEKHGDDAELDSHNENHDNDGRERNERESTIEATLDALEEADDGSAEHKAKYQTMRKRLGMKRTMAAAKRSRDAAKAMSEAVGSHLPACFHAHQGTPVAEPGVSSSGDPVKDKKMEREGERKPINDPFTKISSKNVVELTSSSV